MKRLKTDYIDLFYHSQNQLVLLKGDVMKCPLNIEHWHGVTPKQDKIWKQQTIKTSQSSLWGIPDQQSGSAVKYTFRL